MKSERKGRPRRPRVARIGVSLEGDLLVRLDQFLEGKGYSNRSQGIRDIVRARFVEEAWEQDERPTVATVNLVYDHHQRELLDRLASIQHEALERIVSTIHVHLDHDHCLEVLVLRGPARELKALGDRLIATRGVLHGTMSLSTSGVDLGGRAGTDAPAAAPGHSHGPGEHGHRH